MSDDTPPPEIGVVHLRDCCEGLRELPDGCAQIILCDPPYNIGKDFGNKSDCQKDAAYFAWCRVWITETIRILRAPSPRADGPAGGTIYIYGFSEILAHLQVAAQTIAPDLGVRWLIWHYTNKNVPSL